VAFGRVGRVSLCASEEHGRVEMCVLCTKTRYMRPEGLYTPVQVNTGRFVELAGCIDSGDKGRG
jgi:hypothetical protein